MSYLIQKPDTKKPAVPQSLVPTSSFLQLATYDADAFALTLYFKNRTAVVHRYFFPLTWQTFQLAPSHGSFYAREIKGKYPSITLHSAPKVSDLEKARKKFRPEVTHSAN